MSESLHSIYYRFPKNFPLPMVLDGSTGTSLMREGMPAGSCTEKWVLEHPEVLQKIQQDYVQSGSDALYTPTFGANRPTLERSDLTETAKINSDLVAITKGKAKLIGGDMSPTGLFIEPFGDTPFDEVVEVYREQAEALDKAGVDFFASETNISLQEVRAAVIGIRKVSDKPIFVTMTVDDSGRTLSGDSLVSCLISLAELGISAFGTNCSQGPDGMLELLRELVPYSLALGIPLIAKPNAGMPHDEPDGSRHFDLDADTFAKYVPEFLNSGIPILGGCCGTDSCFIKKIRECADKIAPTLDYSTCDRIDTTSFACTNRDAVEINKTELGEPILADESFYDNAAMAEGEFIYVSIPDEEAADIFIENAPMLMLPCTVTGNTEAIKKAKHYYNGYLLEI
ncbi:MAG: homocysteine S-methyltransferase family protein [Clostridiales bacterium]|nr:homocysteine S-methyltransferase family protein [Clostridiales bacterium]